MKLPLLYQGVLTKYTYNTDANVIVQKPLIDTDANTVFLPIFTSKIPNLTYFWRFNS